MTNELTWYIAKLLPTANSIFANSFYPTEHDVPEQVYCAVTVMTPSHVRVLVTSRLHESSVRIMTPHLASHCIDIQRPAPKDINDKLNTLAAPMIAKIG